MPSSDPFAGVEWELHSSRCICYQCQRSRKRAERLARPRRTLVVSDDVAMHIESLVAAGRCSEGDRSKGWRGALVGVASA